MTAGKKIKLARSLSEITQKELGARIGLSDVRIRQYEIDARTPKEGMLEEIANALGVSCKFFTDHHIDSLADVMHIFFELENSMGITLQEVRDEQGELRYAISFGDDTLNSYLEAWCEHKKATPGDVNSYQLWEARFPENE